MIRAFRLFTGPDGDSHVTQGAIRPDVFVNAASIHFKEPRLIQITTGITIPFRNMS